MMILMFLLCPDVQSDCVPPAAHTGTRFRPLSFEVPKPLFPVAGVPMLQHHIEACSKVLSSHRAKQISE